MGIPADGHTPGYTFYGPLIYHRMMIFRWGRKRGRRTLDNTCVPWCTLKTEEHTCLLSSAVWYLPMFWSFLKGALHKLKYESLWQKLGLIFLEHLTSPLFHFSRTKVRSYKWVQESFSVIMSRAEQKVFLSLSWQEDVSSQISWSGSWLRIHSSSLLASDYFNKIIPPGRSLLHG